MKEKRPTITDVAALAGVSIKSASRVLNDQPGVSDEKRERVRAAIHQLQYVPNPVVQGIRGKSSVVGLVVGELDDYVGQIVRGISQVAHQMHYSLVLYTEYPVEEDMDNMFPLVGSGLICGLLMVIPRHHETLIDLCDKRGLPYVLIDYYHDDSPRQDVPTITVTNRHGVLDAMRHLLALGHRDIGLITGMLNMVSARERYQGYKDGLAELGIPFDPSLVAETHEFPYDAIASTRKLLQRNPRPTAIIAWDDLTAIHAMSVIRAQGLEVGTDISLVGFDDIPAASLVYPALTTIRQPMVAMGEASMELLAALLNGITTKNIHREFPTELIIRESTKPRK